MSLVEQYVMEKEKAHKLLSEEIQQSVSGCSLIKEWITGVDEEHYGCTKDQAKAFLDKHADAIARVATKCNDQLVDSCDQCAELILNAQEAKP
jgi:hypothetical protein